jgi:hypothetical protein
MMKDLFSTLGRPTIKSMDIFVHREDGMGKGCKTPIDLIVSPLLHWCTSHFVTK